MFSGFFGIGRVYKSLPQHRNFAELTTNIEQIANYLLDRGSQGMATSSYKTKPSWDWRLGSNLKELIQYARDSVANSEAQERMSAPKDDESKIVMLTTDLDEVAWLAHVGFKEEILSSKRPTRERSERLAAALDTFDRHIRDFTRESEEQKEERFHRHESRFVYIMNSYK